MPFEIEVDAGRSLVIVVLTGVVSDDDLVQATEYLRGHPDFRPHFDQLVLGAEVERIDVTREGVLKITSGDPIFGGTSRRAIVATTALAFGMSRMFELTRDDSAGHVHVFGSEPEAVAWLGLGPEAGTS